MITLEAAPAWHRLSPCTGMTHQFIPISGRGARAKRETALRICEGCRFRPACLAEAFEQGDDVMIRGGLIPRQRKTYAKTFGRDDITDEKITFIQLGYQGKK